MGPRSLEIIFLSGYQEKILKVEEEKTNKLLAKVQLEITFEIRKKIDLKSAR